MFVTYILKSKGFPKTYVGVTNDINRRIGEHNAGKHSYTKRHIPWEVFYFEEFNNFTDARKREKYFKTASGRRFMKKLFREKN